MRSDLNCLSQVGDTCSQSSELHEPCLIRNHSNLNYHYKHIAHTCNALNVKWRSHSYDVL